jgi:conjugal transfer pilus assembly protein TraV
MKHPAWIYPLTVIATLVLSACGSIGEKEFACPGRPAGVRCMSASKVYERTHHSDVVEPTSMRAKGDEPQRAVSDEAPHVTRAAGEARGARVTAREQAEQPTARPPVLGVDRPLPIRTPAQVMRVWIAPWEDVRGVLHGGEHAFIEIVERRWSIGERETTEPTRFFSLQSPAEPAPESAKVRKSAKAATAAPRPEPASVQHPIVQGESR